MTRDGDCLAPSLTRHRYHREGAHALPAVEPVDAHLVLACGLQAGYGGLTLFCGHRYHLGMPILVLVLDHKGVKLALRDCPREAHGAGAHICHCQVSQAWLQGGLGGWRSLFCLWG